jgi:hypothetical protein
VRPFHEFHTVRLLAKRESRFQQARWYFLIASVSNKSGNLLSLMGDN